MLKNGTSFWFFFPSIHLLSPLLIAIRVLAASRVSVARPLLQNADGGSRAGHDPNESQRRTATRSAAHLLFIISAAAVLTVLSRRSLL